ncbi:THO complex subunit 6 homolog [Takifugu flavidus]|uniref:THO complex subunit 6-like protein WD repeat-containing protein 58 n=1 Tax=Takifugu flavidus TaxID=433684 RepID=A0A5C6NSJ6_9TELE|nr:THO complex subunit 6 homolog [Takifugu flavidus]TWW70492.1 THO complex subunit 6 -like protein WD repeat-containing protein 58 [Takifugu flavidus]
MGPVELLHMSVFSQSFSPCGRFLATGNNYGQIALFSLAAALSPDATGLSHKPVLTFTAHEGPVFCLLSTDTHLVSAGNGEISSWSWSELIKKHVKSVWTKRPNYRSSLEIPEINSMILNSRDNSLIVGAGDNNIHVLDLEHGTFKSVLQGHTDYVHCVSVREREAEILSGGEDGAVRIWDSRTAQSVHCIEVYKYESCARPQYGKWISCLATDSDWMLCGGGPSLSLWHLRSLSPTSVFPLTGCQRQAAFHQDMILAIGDGPFVSHCLLGGDIKAEIPCTPKSLNSLQLNTNSTEHRVLTVGGSSHHIDVFTNLSYRAFSLSF